MALSQDREIVDRPELTEPLVKKLCADDRRAVALTTALHGTGGFGKTTIAIQMCGRPEIAHKFKGGLLWVTIGETTGNVELAAKISDLCAHLTGDRPSFSDAEQAGFRLGHILDDLPDPVLLVVDDVWNICQLRPFLLGGDRCTRLITTRNRLAVPDSATMLVVEKMAPSQANALLTRGITEQIPEELTAAIQAKTGGWPVLLDLTTGLSAASSEVERPPSKRPTTCSAGSTRPAPVHWISPIQLSAAMRSQPP